MTGRFRRSPATRELSGVKVLGLCHCIGVFGDAVSSFFSGNRSALGDRRGSSSGTGIFRFEQATVQSQSYGILNDFRLRSYQLRGFRRLRKMGNLVRFS